VEITNIISSLLLSFCWLLFCTTTVLPQSFSERHDIDNVKGAHKRWE